jgi:cytochrome b561
MSAVLAAPTVDIGRYRLPAIVLHWLIALLIIGMICLGYYMTGIPKNTPERSFFLNLHKSFGLLAAMLILVRLGWRVSHTVPPLPASVPSWQASAARWSHRLLYACMVLQPLTGYVSSSFNKFGIKFFGLDLPNWGWEDKYLRELFVGFHHTIAVVLIVLIVLHVLAALKHLLIDRDGVFQRMLPR